MDYQEALAKLNELQKKIMPTLEELERKGELPENLKVAKAEIIEWTKTVDGKGGLEDQPGYERVEKFAKALSEHGDLFDDALRQDIAAYDLVAAEFPALYENPLGLK